MGESKIKLFTDCLYELVVEQKLSLVQGLEIMAEEKSCIGRACVEIKNELMHGNTFSSAIKICKDLEFDEVYVSFVRISEVNGNLENTLEFLRKRCERQETNKRELVDALIYPLFVIILAIVICIFFGKVSMGFSSASNYSIWKAVGGLLVISIGVFYFIFSRLRENKLYEAFLAVGFLIKAGINVSEALGAGVIITGPGSKYGNYFQKAKKRLEYGMDVFGAFYEFQFDSRMRKVFNFARVSGKKAEVFETIASKIGYEDEKRKKRILSLVEPVFIGITGLFILILMTTYFLPLMTDTSWIEI